VFQCKYFMQGIGPSQQTQIRQSFARVVNSKKAKAGSWTLRSRSGREVFSLFLGSGLQIERKGRRWMPITTHGWIIACSMIEGARDASFNHPRPRVCASSTCRARCCRCGRYADGVRKRSVC
jgi:hypothetical protein